MKIIIAGTRTFKPSFIVENKINQIINELKIKDIVIISGTARGADLYGERYATKKGYSIERYPADWDKYGKKAGYIRNKEMGSVADMAIVLWDGESKGSKRMIDIMKTNNKRCQIINYNKYIERK